MKNHTPRATFVVAMTLALGCLAFAQTTRSTTRNVKPDFEDTHVTGSVTDEQTGEAVATFTVTPGYGIVRDHTLRQHQSQTFSDGALDFRFDRRPEQYTGYHAPLIRIEADGYAPHVVELEPDRQEVRVDVKLRPTANVTGTIMTPDGAPAEDAIVLRVTPRDPGELHDEQPIEELRCVRVSTDGEGAFEFRPTDGEFRIVAIHEAGYGNVAGTDHDPKRPIALQRWGRVEGTVMEGAEPAPDAVVELVAGRFGTAASSHLMRESLAHTDADGRFVFERIAPGKATVARQFETTVDGMTARGLTCATDIDVAPGQTMRVQIGGRGRPVAGKVRLSVPEGQLWSSTGALLIAPAADPQSERHRYHAAVEADGSFEFIDVEPGTYRLHIQFHEDTKAEGLRRFRHRALVRQDVTIPEIPGGRSDEPLHLGELEAKPAKFP